MAPDDAPEIGKRIRAARERVGMSIDVLYAETCSILPRYLWASTEMIRRIEKGTRIPDPVVLSAIADVLTVPATDLAPEMADELQDVRELIERTITMSRWIAVHAGQGSFWPSLVAAA